MYDLLNSPKFRNFDQRLNTPHIMSPSRFGFNPLTLTGLKAWYDFSDLTTITKAADRVSQVNDKSGNTNHIVQATGGNQPLWVSAAQNGLDVVDFVGSRFMKKSWTSIAQPNTIFFSGIMPATGDWHYMISGNASLFGMAGSNHVANSFSILVGAGNNKTDFVDATFHGAWHQLTGIYNGASSDLRADGVAKATAETVDTGSMDGITVGASSGNIEFANIKMGEIIVVDGESSALEISQVEAYFASKWGI